MTGLGRIDLAAPELLPVYLRQATAGRALDLVGLDWKAIFRLRALLSADLHELADDVSLS